MPYEESQRAKSLLVEIFMAKISFRPHIDSRYVPGHACLRAAFSMHRSNALLGIHGLANKPPKEEKQHWWCDAIVEGLQRNCGLAVQNLPLDFVYWADLRYETPLSEDDNLEPYYRDEGTGPFPSFFDHESDKHKISLVDKIYRKIEKIQEKLDITSIDDALIEYRLDDLWDYLGDADFRVAARARFRDALDRHRDADLFIVAHSMGSLVAYDVLRIAERDGLRPRVHHFVSLGAPLGLAEVKIKMREEHGDLIVPQCVRRWSNLLDRDDIATVGMDIHEAYAPNTNGVRAEDIAVINSYRRPSGEVNHHKSYGYLRTPEFSRAVRDFLSNEEQPIGAAAE